MLSLILGMGLTIKYHKVPPPEKVVLRPTIQFGYQGNIYGAHIIDDQASEYFIEYKVYSRLFKWNEYNAVKQFYYNFPELPALYEFDKSNFTISYSTDAKEDAHHFLLSYIELDERKKLYFANYAKMARIQKVREEHTLGSLRQVVIPDTLKGRGGML